MKDGRYLLVSRGDKSCEEAVIAGRRAIRAVSIYLQVSEMVGEICRRCGGC